MKRLPPVTSTSAILVTVTRPIRQFIPGLLQGSAGPSWLRILIRVPPGLARNRGGGKRGALVFAGADRGGGIAAFRGAALRGIYVPRQVQLDRRPLARLAADRTVSPGTRDETIHLRQSEAGALAGFLGREERVEGLFPDLLRHAAAVVGDKDRDPLSGAGGARVR